VEPEQESTSLSPRAARSAKEGAAASTGRRRPAIPTRSKKAPATSAQPQQAAADAGANGTAEASPRPISWLAMESPTTNGPHVAMPRLMGQPAYARPPRPLAVETPRPIDADDLPIEAFRSEEDHQLAERLAHGGGGMRNGHEATLHPSSVGGLRAIAGRLFGRG
jgi:hypothetical protein